jgi:hypothetical protein
MIRFGFSLFLYFLGVFCLFAQAGESGNHLLVLRGEVIVDLEPIYAGHIDDEYPLEITAASRRALEEASLFYSAMIYGWSFYYEPGERARRIAENLEMEPIGDIQFGDSGLKVTDVEIRDTRLVVWTDYHLSEIQQRRLQMWRSGMVRNAQAVGYAPSSLQEYPGWLAIKRTALEDAARAALRDALRGSERNRPKEVTGFISLASFPRFFMDSGRMAAAARFRVQITEIVPFAAY